MKKTQNELLSIIKNNKSEDDSDHKFFKRLSAHNPKTYNGELIPAKLEEWINNIEKILERTDCPKRLRVKIASFYLTGPAELWWRSIKDLTELTWEGFLIKLQ